MLWKSKNSCKFTGTLQPLSDGLLSTWGKSHLSRSFQGQNINYFWLDLPFSSPVSLGCSAIWLRKCLPYQSVTHLLTSELVTQLQVFPKRDLISFKIDHWTEKSKSTSVTWGDFTCYQLPATRALSRDTNP